MIKKLRRRYACEAFVFKPQTKGLPKIKIYGKMKVIP